MELKNKLKIEETYKRDRGVWCSGGDVHESARALVEIAKSLLLKFAPRDRERLHDPREPHGRCHDDGVLL